MARAQRPDGGSGAARRRALGVDVAYAFQNGHGAQRHDERRDLEHQHAHGVRRADGQRNEQAYDQALAHQRVRSRHLRDAEHIGNHHHGAHRQVNAAHQHHDRLAQRNDAQRRGLAGYEQHLPHGDRARHQHGLRADHQHDDAQQQKRLNGGKVAGVLEVTVISHGASPPSAWTRSRSPWPAPAGRP